MNYFGARYYDSDLGRWTSVELLAHLRLGWSPYNYCQNNPVNRVDPTGMLDEGFGDCWDKFTSLFDSNDEKANYENMNSPTLETIIKIDKTIEDGTAKTVKEINSTAKNLSEKSEDVATTCYVLAAVDPEPISKGVFLVSGATASTVSILSDWAVFATDNTNANFGKAAYSTVTMGIGKKVSSSIRASKALGESANYVEKAWDSYWNVQSWGLGKAIFK